MRRRTAIVGIGIAAAGPALLACTALLGTFDVVKDDDAADARADGSAVVPPSDASDGATVTDASDAGALDAGPDSTAPKPCGIDDPLEGLPVLINSLNSATFSDRGGEITPDGRYLLFSRSVVGPVTNADVYAAEWREATQTWENPRALTQLNSTADDGSPTFLPGPTPRIFFSSNRLVGGTNQSYDIYFANVRSSDFSSIDTPTRVTGSPTTVISGGGLEAAPRIVPTGSGSGRMFFVRYVAFNHQDILFSDVDSTLRFSAVQSVAEVNLNDTSQEGAPAFGNEILYFSSNRDVQADGGLVRLPVGYRLPGDAGVLADGGWQGGGTTRVWAAARRPGTAQFMPPALVPGFSRDTYATEVSSVSADGCSFVLAANWPGGSGPTGTYHLYTAKKKRPR